MLKVSDLQLTTENHLDIFLLYQLVILNWFTTQHNDLSAAVTCVLFVVTQSSGLRCDVVAWFAFPDILKECTAFIFEDSGVQEQCQMMRKIAGV